MAFSAKMKPTEQFLNHILSGTPTSLKNGYLSGEIEVAIEGCGHGLTRDQITFRFRESETKTIAFECGPIDVCDIRGNVHLDGMEVRAQISFNGFDGDVKRFWGEQTHPFDEWNW